MVIEASPGRQICVVSPGKGLVRYDCKSIIFAMGCRERTRPAVRIPGTRPAGIFTAGKAQRLVNIEGCLPGRRIVIVGSGDIGMIMARRLTLEGCKVEAVVEILPFTSGLIRNEVQCLRDFGIPLLLGHEVTEIRGYKRVESLSVCARNEDGSLIPDTEKDFDCDTVLLSVGLIPENELSRQAGIDLDAATNGAFVDNLLETRAEGFFSCGNVLHVNDLVDEVSQEGELAAHGAAARLGLVQESRTLNLSVMKGSNIAQVVPQRLSADRDSRVAIRVRRPTGPATVRIGEVVKLRLPLTRPGEMISTTLKADQLKALREQGETQELRIDCE